MPHWHTHRYLHSFVHNNRIGVLLEVGAESDFLFLTAEFQSLVIDLALHIVSVAPPDVESLMGQPFVKDQTRKIADVLNDASEKFQERIDVIRFLRWATDDKEHSDGPGAPKSPAVIMSFPPRGHST